MKVINENTSILFLFFFKEHLILNLKNSWKGRDCCLKMDHAKLHTRNRFVRQDSIFGTQALIVDKAHLPMIVYFAAAL